MASEDELTDKTNLETISETEIQLQIPERETSPVVLPSRPTSATNSITGKALDIDSEALHQLDSPIVAGPAPATEEDNDDEEDDSAGYEESAERDEIIRERINRTQEQMR